MTDQSQHPTRTADRRTLYAIVDDLRDAWELELCNPDTGELNEEAERQLDALQGELAEKVTGILVFQREREALAEARRNEARRLTALARATENEAAALKRYLGDQLRRAGIRSLETGVGTVALQRNSTPSIEARREPEKLPKAYRRVKVEADTGKALELWRAEYKAAREGGLEHGQATAEAQRAVRKAGFDGEYHDHVRIR